MFAAWYGHGANIKAKDYVGRTPLMYAAAYGHRIGYVMMLNSVPIAATQIRLQIC